MQEQLFLLAPLVAFLATVLAIFILRPLAKRIGLLDIPGGRKEHLHVTPVVGGIAIFLGLSVGLLCLPHLALSYVSFMVVGLLILVVGVLDDLHDISARTRLIAQLVALLIMVFWGRIVLEHFGPLLGSSALHLGKWAIPLTLFGAATLINAMNMIDGIDGLAASLAFTALASLCGIAFASGLYPQAMILGLILAALAAFLCFNFPFWSGKKASLFLGDAGSTLLGFVLAWFTIDLSQQPQSIAPPVIMLWVMAIPIMDLAIVFIKRIRQGKSPFKPGKEHIYYVLMNKGLSRFQTVWLLLIMSVIGQGIAWIMMHHQLPDAIIFGVFLVVFIVYSLYSTIQYRAIRPVR